VGCFTETFLAILERKTADFNATAKVRIISEYDVISIVFFQTLEMTKYVTIITEPVMLFYPYNLCPLSNHSDDRPPQGNGRSCPR